MNEKVTSPEQAADLTMRAFKDSSFAAMEAVDPAGKGYRPSQVHAAILGLLIAAYTLHKAAQREDMPGLRKMDTLLDAAEVSAAVVLNEVGSLFEVQRGKK